MLLRVDLKGGKLNENNCIECIVMRDLGDKVQFEVTHGEAPLNFDKKDIDAIHFFEKIGCLLVDA